MKVSREQVVAYRVAAQGLHRGQTKVADLAVLDIGVQDFGANGARFAFDARLAETPPEDNVGPGKSLALVWSLRGAPHIHRRADLNALAGALWPMSTDDALARLDASASLRKAGIDALDAYGLAVQALRDVVTKPMGKGAASTGVTKRVPAALTYECRGCKARHVFESPFRMGALPAGLELEPGTSPPVLRPRSRPTRPKAVDRPALKRLIMSYLQLLGPATPTDVAGYLEARRADIEEHWPGALVELSVDGRSTWLPQSRLKAFKAAPAPELVRLLGAYDPYLQARDRELIVPDKSVHKTLWPVLGRPGVVLADGEVVGTWRPKAAGKKLTLTVEAFATLPSATWDAVEAEATRIAAVRDLPEARVKRVE